MKIVTIDQMRSLEAGALARGVSLDALMERAGLRIAEAASRLVGGHSKGEHVAILIGPGNNGGDGLVAARHLDDWGTRVHVVLCAPRPSPDPKLAILRDRVMDILDVSGEGAGPGLTRALDASRLAIDAVLGASHPRRGIGGPLKAALEELAQAKRRRPLLAVLAADVPSGLDADTGACDPATPPADVTITLGCPKVGLFLFPGAARAGRVEVADIGIPQGLDAGVDLEMADAAWASGALPERPLDGHKGTFGSVLVVAGSERYLGAPALAALGAVRAGAGLVTVAAPRSLTPVIAGLVPEATHIPLPESEPGTVSGAEAAALLLREAPAYDVLLAGCGLGRAPLTEVFLRRVLQGGGLPSRVVLDADALNFLAAVPDWWSSLSGDVVLTPHPGEMGRLIGRAVADVQASRVELARESARRWNTTVLLKGAYSVAAQPSGPARIIPFANPALATAGTGDVLAGVITGLMAQGLPGPVAAPLGAYLHGAAGELRRTEIGEAGLAASDLLSLLPKAIKGLRDSSA